MRSHRSMEKRLRSDEQTSFKSRENKDIPVVRPKQIKFGPKEDPTNLSLTLLENLEGQMKKKNNNSKN